MAPSPLSRPAPEPPSSQAAEQPDPRAAEPPDRRAAKQPSRRAARPLSRPAAEPPCSRAARPPSRAAAEALPPVGLLGTAPLVCRLMLPYLFPDLAAFPTVADLITHLRTSGSGYRAALPAEFCAKNPPPPMYTTLCYIVIRLPDSLHIVRDDFLSVCPTTLTVDLLEEGLLAAEKSIVAVGASRGDPRTPVFEGCSPSPLLPSVASAATADLVGFESGLEGAVEVVVEAVEGVGVVVGVVPGVVAAAAAVEAVEAVEVAEGAEAAEVAEEAEMEEATEAVAVVERVATLRRGVAQVVDHASSSGVV
ncbi:unnamed protein product [Closterium sp. NIES-65]|nr:unnamed protein product [Closterium sp. NIES-65]